MKYIAHKVQKEDITREQTVKDHLEATSRLAETFSLPDFKPIVSEVGKLHDIGKFSAKFQKRINGANILVRHAICGAKECKRLWGDTPCAVMMEYCIAGHHAGLPDGGNPVDIDDSPTLAGQLSADTEDFSAYADEITPTLPDFSAIEKHLHSVILADNIERYAFFTKYVFSCLTDADFIDTEHFCNQDAQRGIDGDFSKALELLNAKLDSFEPDTTVKASRAKLLEQATQSFLSSSAEINLLNMPTGSGKTLCSLKLALEKATASDNKKRIIYVIPYTSIIEQTAKVFTDLFGDTLPVLQHHSNFSLDENSENSSTADKLRRTCENWDAPLIVTTSVQFFQSVYHYKGSRLRKLHNMANSIIVFDEIHLIPIEYLQPCLRAVGYITKYLDSTAIFLSATMPDYTELFNKYIPESSFCELITNKSDFLSFKNCSYINIGQTTLESIACKAVEFESTLIIVNSRRTAHEMYKLLSGKKFHLSTYMTPQHRSRVIEEIKECLSRQEKIAVVSTSLVEAGVDFDFQVVFRQLAGLDNALQAGGRCNREGLRQNSVVFIFETDETAKGDIALRANVTAHMLREYADITTPECIKDYYSRLFGYNNEIISRNSIATFNGKSRMTSIPFRSYAESFKYINNSDTINVVINNCDECDKLIGSLVFGGVSEKRKLQKFSVSVYRYELDQLISSGLIEKINGVFVLSNNDYYDENLGLCKNAVNDSNYIK